MAEVDGSLIDISTDITKLKVPDLKRELKLRGLITTGNKTDLVERLQKSLGNTGSVEHDSVEENEELLEEDILEDDDDEHLDASESLILDNELDESPKGQTLKRKADSDDSDTKTTATKKVVLNRNSSIVTETKNHTEQTSSTTSTEKDESNSDEKKIIKLSQINAKERLELRAKKFGITALSTDAKKAVRAERFGGTQSSNSTNGNSASSITSGKVTTSVDILKKRAERFGCSVSTAVLSLENREKMEKRKARFGVTPATNGVNEDKAKARLERFKQPVV